MSDHSAMNTLAAALYPTDAELLRQVAAGDEVAFAELYDLYAPPVYNYLLRLVNEAAVAEEILQEVFLAMWQGAHRFREEAKVKTWLLRIAHHQAVSWLRRTRATAWANEELEDHEHDPIEEHLARTLADRSGPRGPGALDTQPSRRDRVDVCAGPELCGNCRSDELPDRHGEEPHELCAAPFERPAER